MIVPARNRPPSRLGQGMRGDLPIATRGIPASAKARNGIGCDQRSASSSTTSPADTRAAEIRMRLCITEGSIRALPSRTSPFQDLRRGEPSRGIHWLDMKSDFDTRSSRPNISYAKLHEEYSFCGHIGAVTPVTACSDVSHSPAWTGVP